MVAWVSGPAAAGAVRATLAAGLAEHYGVEGKKHWPTCATAPPRPTPRPGQRRRGYRRTYLVSTPGRVFEARRAAREVLWDHTPPCWVGRSGRRLWASRGSRGGRTGASQRPMTPSTTQISRPACMTWPARTASWTLRATTTCRWATCPGPTGAAAGCASNAATSAWRKCTDSRLHPAQLRRRRCWTAPACATWSGRSNAEILRARPDVNVVAHTHPFQATELSATAAQIRPYTNEGVWFASRCPALQANQRSG